MTLSIVDLPWLPAPPDDFTARCKAVGSGSGPDGPAIQHLATYRLSARQSVSLERAIKRSRSAGRDLAPLSEFRLGVIASATYDLILDCLPAAAARHGVALELTTSPYDQVMQQALDPSSEINAANLDAVLVAVDHRWMNFDRSILDGSAQVHLDAAIERLRAVVGNLRDHGGAPSILQTLPAPPASLFGNLDRRVSGTARAMIDEANRAICALADETGSYLLDTAALAERVGADRWFDPTQWAAFKLPFSADCVPAYCDTIGRLLGAIRGKARKCLVLDLDNTIWGGVIGDDGLGGIYIGQGNARGETFLAVQKAALELRDRGVMLAVCSKNDEAVARAPFREHPEMLLREDSISVFQANWIDKASNLEAIAARLNIGCDALVFLDDNPAERAQVRAALPMVATPELPDDPSWFPWCLSSAGYFEAVSFSADDRLRVGSYQADARRAEIKAKSRDLGDYLSSLAMVIRFSPFDHQGRQRITQLINKTNQFNLTTRRYTEDQIAVIESDGAVFTLQVRLEDSFSDLGMIAIIIARPAHDADGVWTIDTWLMSCRVLGRQVEQAMLGKLVSEAEKRGIRRLVGIYVPTAKNSMVADHYGKLQFVRTDDRANGETVWRLDIASYEQKPLPHVVEDGFQPSLAQRRA